MDFWAALLSVIIIFGIIETIIFFWVRFVRKYFPWLITEKDEKPILSNDGLAKFIPHGYDPELGWVRKPNTSNHENNKNGKTTWNINSRGSRKNPGFEDCKSLISCYGDSFTFARQVNDDETWEHHLSKKLDTNVLNFGVGNYGIDQSLLRVKREYVRNKTKIVILAVVPDTISRILSHWKHYYEYGNTFAFKPRFELKNNSLNMIKNVIDNETKFLNYTDYLSEIQKNDFFYKWKFKKEKLHFPYCLTILKNAGRNFSIMWWVTLNRFLSSCGYDTSKLDWKPMRTIMKINLKWRIQIYKDEKTTRLLKEIIKNFVSYSEQEKFVPVFIFLPQKDDINFMRDNYNFYQEFVESLSEIKDLNYIDVTKHMLIDQNLDSFYSDQNEYGGHYSKLGNEKISKIIYDDLINMNIMGGEISDAEN
jgi:hypothetical protein